MSDKGLDGSLTFSVGLDSVIDVLKKIVPSVIILTVQR